MQRSAYTILSRSSRYQFIACLLLFSLFSKAGFADLYYQPLKFTLRTEQSSYMEGEKVTFIITIENTSKDSTYPVLLPHTQNSGPKLFYLKIFDDALGELIVRFDEDRQLKMMVHDTGTVKIKWLKPREKIGIPIYWNDFDNYYSYHTQTASHHSFGVPLFAGLYKVAVFYDPSGIPMGDNMYCYADLFGRVNDADCEQRLVMQEGGIMSNYYYLKIRRSQEHKVTIEGKKYEKTWVDDRCIYYLDSIGEGGTNLRVVHIDNLPTDSFALSDRSKEYCYNQFSIHYDAGFNEYIVRFPDGFVKNYRKFGNECPTEIFEVSFNEKRRETYRAMRIHDGRVIITHFDGAGRVLRELHYSADAEELTEILYTYKDNGKVEKKSKTIKEPCVMKLLNGH